MSKFSKAVTNNKMSLTNNGAVTHASSGDPSLDLFFLMGSSRGKDITAQFSASHDVDPMLTASIALWGRDIRGGAGEREQFRNYLRFIAKNDPILTYTMITSGKISELGRWDDYLVFFEPGVDSNGEYKQFVFEQIAKGLSDSNTIGLVAKWMPRQGRIAQELGNYFKLSPRNWRISIVNSTKVVEQLMCAREWDKINYSQVPSVASARYQKAFGRHSPEQYGAYINSLKKGEKGVKINASAVYPYDVLKSNTYGNVDVAQAQWDALPNYLGDHGGILPVLDVSGSMGSMVPGQTMTMMHVCISLGLYIALNQKGDFNRIVMNFSEQSKIIKLKSTTLSKLYAEAHGLHWGMNTNLYAAFQNLMQFGLRNNIPNEDMPKTILIISDMEFDRCASMTNMEAIRREYAKAEYSLPNIAFWCLNGRPGNTPVKHNEQGVALISGFSPSIMRSVLGGKNFNPRDIMMETVGKERYQLEIPSV